MRYNYGLVEILFSDLNLLVCVQFTIVYNF